MRRRKFQIVNCFTQAFQRQVLDNGDILKDLKITSLSTYKTGLRWVKTLKIAFSINNRDMLIVVLKTEKIPLEKMFTSQELSRMGQGLGDQLA